MATFEVKDPALKQSLLAHFVQQIESMPECMDELLLNGASGDLIDHLRSKATLSELGRVVAFNRPAFSVTFDDRMLMGCFDQLARIMRDEQIKEYLARNGASTDLLATWFSLSRADADALRSALATSRPAGRPRLPNLDVRDAIHEAWARLPSELPEREAYVELHALFPQLTVAVLYQVVHEHDVPAPVSRALSIRSNATSDMVAKAGA